MRPFPSRNGCMKSSSAWTLATSRMSVSVCLRKFVQEVALQLGHGLVDVYG